MAQLLKPIGYTCDFCSKEPEKGVSICKRIGHNKYESKEGLIIEAGGCHEENDVREYIHPMKDVYEHIKPPFTYDNTGQMIFDSENNLVLDVRAWGMLQYEKNGEELQNKFGQHVVDLLNKDYKNEII